METGEGERSAGMDKAGKSAGTGEAEKSAGAGGAERSAGTSKATRSAGTSGAERSAGTGKAKKSADADREKRYDGDQKPLAFELREINNLIKALIHRKKPADRTQEVRLTQLQGGILGYLYHHDPGLPVYQKNIEEIFRISRATATNTLQVMEKNGLIVRKAQDKDARLKRIFMTEEACRRHTEMERFMELVEHRMLAGLSREEIGRLTALLRHVRDNLERMNNADDRQGADGRQVADGRQDADDRQVADGRQGAADR